MAREQPRTLIGSATCGAEQATAYLLNLPETGPLARRLVSQEDPMTDTPAPPRRRLSPGIKSLIAVLIALGLSAGWFTVRFRRAQRQRQAVNQIRRAGGWYFYDCRFDRHGTITSNNPPGPKWFQRLMGVDFLGTVDAITFAGPETLQGLPDLGVLMDHGIEVTDASLEPLKELPDVQYLALSHARLTGRGIEKLRSLKKLRRLWLNDTPVGDAELESLRGLTRLEGLWLDDTRVTDAGLDHLGRLTRLKTLSLKRTRVSDAGLVSLAALTGLKTLALDQTDCSFAGVLRLLTDLQHRGFEEALDVAGYARAKDRGEIVSLDLSITDVADDDLIHLARLSQLQWLRLGGTGVTDAGLAHLEGLTHVTFLDLADTRVTDAGLKHLEGFRKLRILHLGGTRATPDAVAEFRKTMPAALRVYLSSRSVGP